MKNQKNKNRDYLDIITDINKLYLENNNCISEKDANQMSMLFSETEIIRKAENNSILIFLIVGVTILIFIGFFVFTQFKEIELLKNDIEQKSQIINRLKSSNMNLNYKLYGYYVENEDSVVDFSYDLDLNPIINRKGKILSYKDIRHEYDSLSSLANKLQKQIEIIYEIYEIKFEDDYFPFAPKLDSALLLLPAFRNNLKYDSVSKTWHIYIRQ